MRRLLFNFARIVSALLCAGMIVSWIRSQYAFDSISWTATTSNNRWVPGHPTAQRVKAQTANDMTLRRDVLCWDGCFGVGRHFMGAASKGNGPLSKVGWDWKREDQGPTNLWGFTERWYEKLGFYHYKAQWRIHDGSMENRYAGRMWFIDDRVLVAPHWFLVTITSVLPLYWLIKTLRLRQRSKLGCCPMCGYDLRATLERCPECGEIPTKTTAISS